MDFRRALGTEFQQVREIEHQGQAARAVQGTRFYATEPEDLWDALTSAERLPRWFLPISGDLRLGGRYQLEGNAGGKITRCDAPEALDVTWEMGDNVSWVSVRLVPEDDGVRLTLVHTMLQDEASEKHWTTYGPGATGVGWDLSFFGLGMFLDGMSLDSSAAFDRAATDAWLTSDEGKAFMRASAASWARAHVASGEDAEIATAMAERTASFYTGS